MLVRKSRLATVLAISTLALLATACPPSSTGFPSAGGAPAARAPIAPPPVAAPAKDRQQPSGIEGAWCAQGDPKKKCSIGGSGALLTFTNEVGSKSPGRFVGTGQTVVRADQWNGVQGTLSRDGRRIDWSNHTFWTRCPGGGSGGGERYTPANLDGTWYQGGDRAKSCFIQQRDGNLSLTNEVGQRASGKIDGPDRITTTWAGKRISGRISRDGRTISWDNGTTWSR